MVKHLKDYFIASIFLLAPSTLFADEVPENIPGATLITAEYLQSLESELASLVVIDNRDQFARDKGYIPESVSMSEAEINAQTMLKLIGSKETPVAFYCDDFMCMSSVYAVRFALKEGYQQVYWLRGGIAEWRQFRFPVSNVK